MPLVRNGEYQSAQRGFDEGRFLNRNIWDRRYPVVDEERGIVLSIVRFGLKGGAQSQSAATTNDRLVAEFFAVKHGYKDAAELKKEPFFASVRSRPDFQELLAELEKMPPMP